MAMNRLQSPSPFYDARTYLLKWIEDAKVAGIKELLKLVDLVKSHKGGHPQLV